MTDVILAYPFNLDSLPRAGALLPPLSLAYLQATLKKNAYECEVIDCNGRNIPHESCVKLIREKKPKVVGITATTPSIRRAVDLAERIKAVDPDIFVVFGGPHVTVLDKDIFGQTRGVDCVVRGEGEATFLELVGSVVKGGTALAAIDGITYRSGGGVVRNPDRKLIANIDDLPCPQREISASSRYRMALKWDFKKPFATLVTSRGCPFECRFCNVHRVYGRKVRFRTVASVVSELKDLVTVQGVRDFIFYDDTLTLDKKRTIELCDSIIKNNLDISWGCYSRVNAINESVVRKMKEAGCRMISFGVESGSDVMLGLMKKGIRAQDSIDAISLCNRIGVETSVSVVLGFPGETKETMQETIAFLKKLNPHFVAAFRFIPFPGTEFFSDYLKQIKRDGLSLAEYESLETDHLFVIDDITTKDIQSAMSELYFSFYFRPSKIFQHLMRVLRSRNLFISYLRACSWLLFQKR